MTNLQILSTLVWACFLILPIRIHAVGSEQPPPIELFMQTGHPDEATAQQALERIGQSWKDRYAAIILDVYRVKKKMEEQNVIERLENFLKDQTGKRFPARDRRSGEDYQKWRQWTWSLPYEPHPEFSRFKGEYHANIDPKMREFFPPDVPASIRLDEVDWGGVRVNGIPPWTIPSISRPLKRTS